MVWVKLDDSLADSPLWDEIGWEALALHVAALSYVNRVLSDGLVTYERAKRLTGVPNVEDVIRRLVSSGAWDDNGETYVVVLGMADQMAKSEALAAREKNRANQRRFRAHRAGDHSLCLKGVYCPEGQVEIGKSLLVAVRAAEESAPLGLIAEAVVR